MFQEFAIAARNGVVAGFVGFIRNCTKKRLHEFARKTSVQLRLQTCPVRPKGQHYVPKQAKRPSQLAASFICRCFPCRLGTVPS